MKKKLTGRLVLTLFVVFLALYLTFPIKGKIKLGLDLKGGIHLVLQVNTEDAVGMETDDKISRLEERFKKNGIDFESIVKVRAGRFTVQGLNPGQYTALRKLLAENEGVWDIELDQGSAVFEMKEAESAYLRDQAVDQALEIIRKRIDEFGVAEPTIQRRMIGGDQIIVELPGAGDPDRVKNLLQTTALLELKLVTAGPAADREELLAGWGGTVPETMEVVTEDGGRTGQVYYLVNKVAVISGNDLRNAYRSMDEWNNPAVAFRLNPEGARRFREVSSENIGRALAIILDGEVRSAPVIETEIYDSGIIRGDFTDKDAGDLALVLRAGALPASIEYLEERTIGPALGADSIRQGLQACLVSLALVMLFMLGYYRTMGVNANAALILNMILLLGALSYFRATLSLPGIAGIILSIGMAVDANVLIFERIKEEAAMAKSLATSIALGFKRAFSAILDSNVTTVIAAVFLFQFGTGPVKGYAITLIIGITASMFTAVYVSHLIFDLTVLRRNSKTKQIRALKTSLFKKTNIRFMRYKIPAFALSGTIIAAGIVNITAGSGLKYGIDFTGGSLIRVQFRDAVSVNDIRQRLKDIGLGGSTIQAVGRGEREYMIRSTLATRGADETQALESHEIIGSRIVDALRGAQDKLALERGLKDLNTMGEEELTAFLQPSAGEGTAETVETILALRIDKGLIGVFNELQERGVGGGALDTLKEKTFLSSFTVLSKETVGPQVGKNLRMKATQATIWALVGMLIYIGFRFKLSYGVSAVLTLAHDVLVTLSVLSFTNREINLPVIAAILTIVGFSLNDTIVIFDRVRDNLKTVRRQDFADVLNLSVNQTLSRSIITSGTVFLTVIALFFFGGEVINDFAFTMLIGVISGSYSTIYQSCPIVHVWQKVFKTRAGFRKG